MSTLRRLAGWLWRAALAEVGGMHPKPWLLLDECVERGVAYGWRHAHKHYGEVDEAAVREAVAGAMGTRNAKVEPIVAAVMALLANRPSEDHVCSTIHDAVMADVGEHFGFPEVEE